jgi:hypothetical protein
MLRNKDTNKEQTYYTYDRKCREIKILIKNKHTTHTTGNGEK